MGQYLSFVMVMIRVRVRVRVWLGVELQSWLELELQLGLWSVRIHHYYMLGPVICILLYSTADLQHCNSAVSFTHFHWPHHIILSAKLEKFVVDKAPVFLGCLKTKLTT